jgi:hypothetical protein
MRRLILVVGVVLAWSAVTRADEIGFIEDFSLAADRTASLKQLIPGTEDYYYYYCLHYLNTEQFDKVDELLAPWVQRHGETSRVWEVRTRQALLTYERNPQKSLAYLKQRLNLQFNHQKELLENEPNLPTAFDQTRITRQRLMEQAVQPWDNLSQFEDSALEWLVAEKLPPERLRNLLQRLSRPDYAGLPKLIVDDLNYKNSGGFGAFKIHRQLLLAQLDECLKLKPDLLNQTNFVQTYLTKLQPGVDDDWRHDLDKLDAYLSRLAAFVDKLAPAHNSLKAHVLYQQLVLDRKRGKFDKERFVRYLQLPRNAPYLPKQFVERDEYRRFAADLNADFGAFTLLAPVGNDEALVRSYLAHFFIAATGYKEFEQYVNDIYLKHLFAETKIVHGLGEPEQWASLLPPEKYQQLKERVDIDFAFTNETSFTADESVKLDLFVKNVSSLIVKVFEINTQGYYRQQLREVDTDINLDGLVANEEKTHPYANSPLLRVARKFEFPKLSKSGVYVIDFIGNGRSSRALVRKGKLHQVVRTGSAGQIFTVLDEKNRPVDNATVWLAGHEYRADKDGTVTVPFSTAPGRQPIVLGRGDFASLDHFNHEGERYTLKAGIYVDRESLLTRKTAELVVRPGLYLNGAPVSLKLLEEVKLLITSTDHDGVATSQELPDFKLFEDRDSVHEFNVPARLDSISFTLRAKVKSLSTGGQKVDLAVSDSFSLNQIDKGPQIEDLHLAKVSDEYVLELLGKTGEPRTSRPVQVTLKHRDFTQQIFAVLKSDPRGRIALGALKDIVLVTASDPDGTSHSWALSGDQSTYPGSLHGRVGDTLTLPYLGKLNEPARSELSLLELRGETYVADRFENLAIRKGLLNIEKLPAGDYDLLLKQTGSRVRVRVVSGEKQGAYILGQQRQLETRPLAAVQIESISTDKDKLAIRLQNSSKYARVHVFATRYLPDYSAYGHLSQVRDSEPSVFMPGSAESVYLTGRNIGDEYRYIIDRKYAKKYPGNSLDRPSLLLNPWAVRSTETGEQLAEGGDMLKAAGGFAGSNAQRGAHTSESSPTTGVSFADLDFLAHASAVLLNLAPDKDGLISIDRAAIGSHQQLHVVAVDPLNTTFRQISLPETSTVLLDLRLLTALNPDQHFTQQKQVSVIPAGQPFVLADITTSKFEAYDSLARIYGLYNTLTHDGNLAEFGFLLNWPKLKPEEKQAQYSKYASHELSFFLSRKDPEFFQQVIRPYLANKKDKTFVDHWLLADALEDYRQPWKHGQLNTAERVLLAQRINGERPITARQIADQFSLLPPNIDRTIHLFDTAVKGSALETADTFGLKDAAKKAMPEEAAMRFKAGDGPAAGAAAPMAMPAAPPAAKERLGRLADKQMESLRAENEQVEKSKQAAQAKDGKSRRNAEMDAKGEMKKAQDELFFERADRDQVRQLYRKLDQTMEWAENNYHHRTIDQQNADLITVGAFWRDYAGHDPAQPFFTRNLADASRNFPEMLLALSVLDLPFEPGKHTTKFDGVKMTLTPASPMVIYHEEIKPAKPAEGAAPILVSQNLYKLSDRYRQENGEQVDKFVTEEFVIHTVYGCQVVVTNPTSARQKLSVLLQIPRGAIPVLNSQATRTAHVTLEPYHTQTIDYHFYFPTAGKFPHYPVHVSKNEDLIAFAQPFTFNVVDKPTKIDTESWEYVSQYASNDEVLKFLSAHNINSLNLEKIAFRMREPAFFSAAIQLLTQRHVYQHTLWSYSLMHNVPSAAREFLQYADQIVNECGGRLVSPLLTVDPVARHTFEHLEYKPLVNARAHSLGKHRQILNNRFFAQYHQLLKELGYERQLNDDDILAVTYYLLLQDRTEESLATFGRVNADRLATRLQYDYCSAYLDFFTDETQKARAIAIKYAKHPVDRWRNAFAAITMQLDEIDGRGPTPVDSEDRNQQQTQLAASEPNFDFQVEAKQIVLNYQNLEAVQVNFYLMDVELLFSRNPFVQQFSGQFSSIRPNLSEVVGLKPVGVAGKIPDLAKEGAPAAMQGTIKIPLPKSLHNTNVLVEITGGGQTKSQAYYSHSLAVQTIETYGQVRVTQATGSSPVAKAYVKVYAQTSDGQVRFYKDGYTDLRGRFDYASLNTNELDNVQKFSLLILSDEHGALVREANPPKR